MIEEILIININRNPWQPRIRFDEDEIAELARKIKEKGLIQYPLGRRLNGNVELAVGERRLLAFQYNRMTSMPVDIRELSDEEMAEYAMSENMDRVDLSRIEIANGLQKWAEDFGWSHEVIAEKLGKSREWVTNTLRLLDLPEDVKEKVNDGTLSARQGEAVLAITKLPESVVERAKENGHDPNDDLEKAKEGELTSDQIRNEANWYVRQYTEKVTDAVFPLGVVFGNEDEYLSPTCDLCERRIQHGSEMRCPEKECWDAKSKAWESIVLEKAASESEISILELAEGESFWQSVNTFHIDDHTLGDDGIFAEGCPNLRLRFKAEPYASEALDLENHPQVAIVCHHGAEGPRCECETKKRNAAKSAAKKEEKQDPEYQAKKERERQLAEQVVTPAANVLADAFEVENQAAWLMIYQKLARTVGSEKWTVDTIRQRIAKNIVEKALPYWEPEKNLPAAQSEIIKKVLNPIGREDLYETYPMGDPIDELEKRLERVQGWVGSLSTEVPTPEAVKGNIVNLEGVLFKLEQLSSQHPKDERITRIGFEAERDVATLKAILAVLDKGESIDVDQVYQLLNFEDFDEGYELNILGASKAELGYALALASDDEQRVEILNEALRA